MGGQHCTVCPDTDSTSSTALSVRLVTPLVLLAQAVATALRSRGVVVECDTGRRGRRAAPSEVMVVIDDLVSAADVRRVLALLGSAEGPVLVLTGRERGHYWGALVSAGATSIMSSASSLDDVVRALEALREGDQVLTPEECAELVMRWDLFLRQQREVAARLAKLTPRERAVFAGLRDGVAVPELATRLEVAETTVRSHVKSILRKMRVRSQLTAVAMVHRLETPLVAASAVPTEPMQPDGETEPVRSAD